MKLITLSKENISDEHICCAFSDKKCKEGYEAKKQWLKKQFENGYVFRKADVRGKVFIEYVDAENVWLPVDANNYLVINCFWVSGKYKGQGLGKQLYNECLKETRVRNKDGIVVVTGKKKQPFMSEKKFFQKQGFELFDTAEPYFELWGKKLNPKAENPKFKDCAKNATCDNKDGLTVYYTNACPFTEYYVAELEVVAVEQGFKIKTVKIETKEQAQNHFVPFTNYSVFQNGRFVTQHILNERYFQKFIK